MKNKKAYITLFCSVLIFIISLSFYSPLGALSGEYNPYDGIFNTNLDNQIAREADFRELGNRKYTIQEMFQVIDSIHYSKPVYKETIFNAPTNKDLLPKATPEQTGEYNFIEGTKKAIAGINGVIADMLLEISRFTLNIFSNILNITMSNSLICNPDEGIKTNCVDLVGIISGSKTNPNDGILRTMVNGIYFPFVSIVIALSGIWVVTNGIIHHQVRETINGLIWIFGVFCFTILMLMKPNLVAQAPLKATTMLSQCILQAVNGQSCLNSDSVAVKEQKFVSKECIAYSNDAKSSYQKTAFLMKGLTCEMWKGMYLNNWSKAYLGVPYSDFTFERMSKFTNNSTEFNKMFEFKQFSTNSPNTMNTDNKVNSFTSEPNNNALGTILAQVNGEKPQSNQVKNDFIDLAIKYPTVYDNLTGARYKALGSALVALITTVLAVFTLIKMCISAMGWSFLIVILIAFGPIFALLGMHPGKGRKIFLGWIEQLVNGLLKYAMLSLIVLIGIMFISSIVATTEGVTQMVATLIISWTITALSKSLPDTVGSVSFGGEKSAATIGNILSDKVDGVKKATTGAIGNTAQLGGAYIGGFAAAEPGQRKADAKARMKDEVYRKLAASGGFFGAVGRSGNRTRLKAETEAKKKAKQVVKPHKPKKTNEDPIEDSENTESSE